LTSKRGDFEGFLLDLDEARLAPCEDKARKKHRNMPLCGGFGYFALPYGGLKTYYYAFPMTVLHHQDILRLFRPRTLF
jgi:hypothetical protein